MIFMVGRHREQAVMLVSEIFVKPYNYKIIQLFRESIPLSAVKSRELRFLNRPGDMMRR